MLKILMNLNLRMPKPNQTDEGNPCKCVTIKNYRYQTSVLIQILIFKGLILHLYA